MNRSENENKKKTNYQRLWRNSKKQEILSHNFAEDVVQVSKTFLSENLKGKELKEKLEAFDKTVQVLRNRYTQAALKI